MIFTIGASISESQNFARPFSSCSIISDPCAREPSWINFAILVPFHHHVCPSSTITAIPSCAFPSHHTLLRFGNDDKEAVFTATLGERYKCCPIPGGLLSSSICIYFSWLAMMKLYIGSRQPAASSSTVPAPNLVKDDFPEALTYRFNDNSAWVPAARTHDVSLVFMLPLLSG